MVQPAESSPATDLLESLVAEMGDGDEPVIPPDAEAFGGEPAETPAVAPEAPVDEEVSREATEEDSRIAEYEAELERSRAQLKEYERQVAQQRIQQAEAEQRAQMSRIEQAEREYAAQLEQTQGLPPRLAQEIARQQADLTRQLYQAKTFNQAKMNAAMHYAQQYGVQPTELMNYNSPQEMELAAQRQSEVANLRKEIEALKQAQVVPQQMDSAQGAATMSSARRLDAFADGRYNDINAMQKFLESQGVNFGL